MNKLSKTSVSALSIGGRGVAAFEQVVAIVSPMSVDRVSKFWSACDLDPSMEACGISP
jgi:hypothetical protein